MNTKGWRGALLLLTHEFPPYPGGVARYCASLATAATRLGYDVTVIAPDYGSVNSVKLDGDPGLHVIRFPGDIFKIKDIKQLGRIIDPVLRSKRWAIVHAADWPMIMTLKRPEGFQGKLIASLHGSDVMVMRHSWKARLAGSHNSLRGFDRYVCNSRYTASLLAKAFPSIDNSKIRVALLGVDETWFDHPTPADIAALKQKINYRNSDLIVLTVARLDPRKGHLQTISALAVLPPEIKSRVKYVCIGLNSDLELTERITSAAKAAGISVCITGALPIEQVRAAYSVANVFALTAEPMVKQIEGFGLVLLEAAAAGLPAVVARVHAIPEVVIDNVTGWIARSGDLAGIAQLILAALQLVDKVQMHDACVKHARSCTWEACAEATYLSSMEAATAFANRA
jgi:phosphatidylinositol alpha-1,6-mannosyltransferase